MSTETKVIPISDMQIAAFPKSTEIIRRDLSEKELMERALAMADNLNKIEQEDNKLKEIKAEFDARTSPLKTQNKGLLNDIRNKFVDEEHEVYLIPNYENNRIEYVSTVDGTVLGDRRMTQAERQGNIFNNK